MFEYISENYMYILTKAGEHLYISLFALVLGVIVAVPIGIALTRSEKAANLIIGLASVFQTIPSLSLLAIMIPIFGIGTKPAVVALFIYSLLPILRNTYQGMKSVDKNIIDAAKGMGMTNLQSIIQVELPLAAPIIMSGIRLSAVYVIAWATLSAYIGAGGLGDIIFNGLNTFKVSVIIAGTVPVSLLALLMDFILGKAEALVTPFTGKDLKEAK